jgi:hypothetical protein
LRHQADTNQDFFDIMIEENVIFGSAQWDISILMQFGRILILEVDKIYQVQKIIFKKCIYQVGVRLYWPRSLVLAWDTELSKESTLRLLCQLDRFLFIPDDRYRIVKGIYFKVAVSLG